MSVLARLARRGHLGAKALDAFNPDQARDERGQWTSDGGGPGSGASTATEHTASAKYHKEISEEHASRGERAAAAAHTAAVKRDDAARAGGGGQLRGAFKKSGKGYTTEQISRVLLRDKSFVESLPPVKPRNK